MSKKITSPTNTSNLLSHLKSSQRRLCPHHQGILGNTPEGNDAHFAPDPMIGTAIVACE